MLKQYIEKGLFGVCQKIGDKFNISTHRIRLYFIYTSFLTFGSPIFIYLICLFWLNFKAYKREAKKSIWEL